ncbi:MAG: sulfite exporter TauE/SafE family protein [Caldimonas sp.]
MDDTLALGLLIALVGGLVRGTTGFGAAMVMTPALSLLIGPKTAVPVTLLLETFAALPMLPAAARIARWRVIAPISVAAFATVPLGGWLLAGADPKLLRYLIATTVIVFSLALLSGRRYRGAQRTGTSIGLGALSGAMLGATSIGAPPVILYLLSGPDAATTTRANLTLYVVAISAAGLVMLAVSGLMGAPTLRDAGWLALPFAAGVVAGSRLFARFSDLRFRQLTMVFMLLVAIGVLLA